MKWRDRLSREAAHTFQRLATAEQRRVERSMGSRPGGRLVKAIQGTKDAFSAIRRLPILDETIDADRTVLMLSIIHRRDLEAWLKRQH